MPIRIRARRHHRVMHGIGVKKCIVLAQEPHGDATAVSNAAGIGFKRAREHGKQGRFAVAVAPYDANAVAFVHAEGDAESTCLVGNQGQQSRIQGELP